MIFNDMLYSGGLVTSEVVVTIRGRNKSVYYDSNTYSVSGYTYTISNSDYTVSDFSFSGTASASGTTVGTYSMGLTSDLFTNNNPKFTNVTFNVTDGYVKINSRPVTVTADALSKTYDNDSTTDPELTATVSNLIDGDSVTYTISRKSGQSAGSYKITVTGDTTQGNYTVSYVSSTFTINPASVTLTSNSGEYTYTGSSITVSGFTSSISGLTFSGVSASATRKNAGTSNVSFSGLTVGTTTDSTGNYVVDATVVGTLVINPASVTLTSNSGTYTYNGSSRTVSGFTSSVSGLSFSGVSASATRTNYGTSNVSFSGLTVGTTTDTTGNYVVDETVVGTLTINRKSVTIKAKSYTIMFDQSIPTLAATVSGLVGSDTVSYSLSTDAVQGSSAGTYDITVTATTNQGNYTITTTSGTLTISGDTGSILLSFSTSVTFSIAYMNGSDYLISEATYSAGNYIIYGVDPNYYYFINHDTTLYQLLSVTAGNRTTISV